MNTQTVTVSKFIGQQIERSGRLQEEIATDCGFVNPNMISMIKNGVTKLPLAKIGVLAKALDIDPAHLLRLAMWEYMPEAWAVFELILGRSTFVTEAELDLLGFVRHDSSRPMIDLSIIGHRHCLSNAISEIAALDLTDLEAQH